MTDNTNNSIYILEQIVSGVTVKQLLREQLLETKLSLDATYVETGKDSPDILNRIEKLKTLPTYMNNPESIQIIDRFYKALNMLIDNGTLKSKRAFALSHGIEYTSFSRCEKEK